MPIVDLDPLPLGMGIDRPEKGYVTPGADEVHDRPSFKDLTEATFRRENMLASAAQVANGIDTTPDPDFKPFDEIKGTPYEPHFNAFLDVQNRAQHDEVKRRIDQETEDRKTVDAAPLWMSLPASLMANVTDPSILAPGGAFVRGAKGGWSMLKSGAAVGTAAAGGTTAQEAFLHGTQFTRTPEESVFSIGSSFVLGGLLGAGGSALLNKAEWKSHVRALDRELAGSSPQSIKDNPLTAPIYEDVVAQLRAAKGDVVEQAKPIIEDLRRIEENIVAATERKNAAVEQYGHSSPEAAKAFDELDEWSKAHTTANNRLKEIQNAKRPDMSWMGEDEIEKYAAVTAARYQARAEWLGGDVSAHDLYKGEGIEVRGPGAPAAEGRAFDQGSEPERIVSSALRFEGKIYQADMHFSALVAAAEDHKMSLDEFMNLVNKKAGKAEASEDLNGFMTSRGRFVSREEANEIAKRAEQKHAGAEDRGMLAMEELSLDQRPGFGLETIKPGRAFEQGGNEKIQTAAIRVEHKVYTGASHGDAVMAAEDALGLKPNTLFAEGRPPVDNGFVTTTGRFVDRHEADRIARGDKADSGGLDSWDLPALDKQVGQSQPSHQVKMREVDDAVHFTVKGGGELTLNKGDNALAIVDVMVPPDMRKQGRAIALYEAAIKYAQERGLRLVSDVAVSKDAVGVYEALQRRGYEVIKTPGAKELGSDLAAPLDMKGPDHVFEIRPRRSFNQSQPGFFSAVSRVVDEAKQDKAPGAQWLGMLKNKPGVKPEELEWLGLETWLKEQKSVTKAQVQDYIRANNIEVKEVMKGHEDVEPEWTADTARQYVINHHGGKVPRSMRDELRTPSDMQTGDDWMRYARRIWWEQAKSPTKFSEFQLPGGENYRELLLTLPSKKPDTLPADWTFKREPDGGVYVYNSEGQMVAGGTTRAQAESNALFEISQGGRRTEGRKATEFRSEHWDEPNVVSHIRFDDRTIDGKRSLFIQEIQSDWHQKGRKSGYIAGPAERSSAEAEVRRLEQKYADVRVEHELLDDERRALQREDRSDVIADKIADINRREEALKTREGTPEAVADHARWQELEKKLEGGVPDAPFKTTWPELSLKRVVRYAAENGYERVSWPGSPETVAKIEGWPDFKKVGDRWMAGDKDVTPIIDRYLVDLPRDANNLTKKYGVRTGKSEIEVLRDVDEGAGVQRGANGKLSSREVQTDKNAVHTLTLTPELKQAAMGGFPLFQSGAEGVRGRITLSDNKAIIDLFQSADRSTFLHEMGHKWLDELAHDASRADVPQALKDDLGTVLRWLKVDKIEDLKVAQHEQWAKAFERYLAEGKAPSSALAQAFESFKQWLTSIYKSLTSIDSTITDDIRGVMDRMLASDAEMKANRAYGPGSTFPSSVGAAAVEPPSIAKMGVSGRAAGAIASMTQWMNPGLRLIHSVLPESRDIAANLAEMSTHIRGNQDGFASPLAVETLRKEWNAGLMQSVQDTRDAYIAFRKRGGGYGMVERVADLSTNSQRSSFYGEVGKAMRRGDEHAIPEVAQAAKSWRKNVFDPLKEAAIEAKLLPKDVDVETAISYFSRMWSRKRLIEEEHVFKGVVVDWVNSSLPRWMHDFDLETAKKAAKMEAEKQKEYLIERRIEREAMFDSPKDFGKGIANEVFDKLTGKTSEGTRPDFITITARGPLKERTFNIPDELVEQWLEHDVRLVGERYSRIMSADVELARKFGSPDMKDQIAKIHEGYEKLREGETNPNTLRNLNKARTSDIDDITGLRDIIRGTYGESKWEQGFGHFVRVANNLQYLYKMGGVTLNSLSEPFNVAASRGLINFMGDAFAALRNIKAVKMQVKESQLGGNITDRGLAHSLSSAADLTNYYSSRGTMEKFMDNLTNVASAWNGIRLWTNFSKSVASTAIHNRILQNVTNFGSISAREKEYLAHLGINQSTADRIAKQFNEHGRDFDGVFVANTERWGSTATSEAEKASAEVTKRHYRAAVNKDLDSRVVTKGAADLPLFANTPLGRLLFQFNTFNLASHQRILLRGLQEGHGRFLSSVVAMSSMGMLVTYLQALRNNTVDKLPDIDKNPGWWMAEGLDKSGIFSIPTTISNGIERMTGINPVKSPLKIGDEGNAISTKNRNRNISGYFTGPTGGTVEDIKDATLGATAMVKGEEVKAGQTSAAIRLIPFNSYLGIRELLTRIISPPQQ